VLLHDPLLELGTTLPGWAHQHTAAEIRTGRLRRRDGTPSDEHPLVLDELLGLAPTGARLQLEVKAHADPALARRTTRAICDRLADHPARARSEILSFFTTACELAGDLGFRTRLIMVADYRIDALATWAQAAGVHGICVEYFLLSPALVGTLRASALSVTTGTVNHPALLARLLPLALDAISSDTPAESCGRRSPPARRSPSRPDPPDLPGPLLLNFSGAGAALRGKPRLHWRTRWGLP
jgi:glycerophosphoryl diester phosphodiesterase